MQLHLSLFLFKDQETNFWGGGGGGGGGVLFAPLEINPGCIYIMLLYASPLVVVWVEFVATCTMSLSTPDILVS